MANRGKQCAKIMYAAEEDAADQDPQRAGKPAEAETNGTDGASNGAGTSNRGKMMAHQNRGLRRNIVHAIFQGVCRGLFAPFAHAPLLAQPAAIENIAAQQHNDADD